MRATTDEITVAHTFGRQFANPLRSVTKERRENMMIFPFANKRRLCEDRFEFWVLLHKTEREADETGVVLAVLGYRNAKIQRQR